MGPPAALQDAHHVGQTRLWWSCALASSAPALDHSDCADVLTGGTVVTRFRELGQMILGLVGQEHGHRGLEEA